ncbi:MAG: hypothetical protein JNM26_12355, partial [Ideonella sp.]|nr:hypothetical protein [Ideonella sp.]
KHGATQYRLNKDRYTLLEFLRLVGNLREHPIDLDLDSMSCPFAVRVRLQQPYETNDVVQIETRDDNRAYLLDWLSKLKPRWANEAQQMDLHGTDMLVQVPCGRLNLLDIARPAAPAASASQAGG